MAPVPRTYSPNDIENQAGTHPPPNTANLLTSDEARRIAANVAKLPPQAATAVEACSSGRRACPYRAAGSAACRKTDDRILTGNSLRTASTP
jgi:hypothetical protein